MVLFKNLKIIIDSITYLLVAQLWTRSKICMDNSSFAKGTALGGASNSYLFLFCLFIFMKNIKLPFFFNLLYWFF